MILNVKIKISEKRASYSAEPHCFKIGAGTTVWPGKLSFIYEYCLMPQ